MVINWNYTQDLISLKVRDHLPLTMLQMLSTGKSNGRRWSLSSRYRYTRTKRTWLWKMSWKTKISDLWSPGVAVKCLILRNPNFSKYQKDKKSCWGVAFSRVSTTHRRPKWKHIKRWSLQQLQLLQHLTFRNKCSKQSIGHLLLKGVLLPPISYNLCCEA